ncbi:TIP41-like protein [Manihot esculenta]|uniref:TIP41-like protein n=1 Tax=Manihot esculenta TaxID=3983 RepID=UPI001CC57E86|nr:TIP41-like protein [Manihot esculenta]
MSFDWINFLSFTGSQTVSTSRGSKLSQQVILDYDYTFTTPYCGSETIEVDSKKNESGESLETSSSLCWVDCKEQIDVVSLASKEPILFYDEVVNFEDELADYGVSLLIVKVRVMPSCWFLLLRFWLRVDGALMRLRDTRMHCTFGDSTNPVILRESCWREATFQSISAVSLSLPLSLAPPSPPIVGFHIVKTKDFRCNCAIV